MKTLTGHKSLLLGSGLLLISLIGLCLGQPNRIDNPRAQKTHKKVMATKCRSGLNGASCIKNIAEKLFPALKILNVM
jgi:hypothetical protein